MHEQTKGNTIPERDRPEMVEGYAIDRNQTEDMLAWEWLSERMEKSHNYWVSTTRPDGKPHAMPVWAVWLDNTVYFGTSYTSRKGRNLAANPEIVIHLESGDEVVIFEGTVEDISDIALLTRIAEAMSLKYPGYTFTPEPTPGNVMYGLRPRVAFAWVEKDFAKSATRWRFP